VNFRYGTRSFPSSPPFYCSYLPIPLDVGVSFSSLRSRPLHPIKRSGERYMLPHREGGAPAENAFSFVHAIRNKVGTKRQNCWDKS